MDLPDYEKLGAFYLGREYDLDARARRESLLMYDSKDLVTHAVCVGMTGSGKTGLCVGVLEEAAIDGIPAIIIDPKGDLANLMLTFPGLRGEDFAPWVNEEDARRNAQTTAEFGAAQADRWRAGLAEWGQDGARVERLRTAVERTVYTPASNAGTPVSVLSSFKAPPFEVVDDVELFRERIASTVASVLGLLGITADPLTSREHILLSAIFAEAWGGGRDLDMAGLISGIQSPPLQRIGVMELESFFPAKERFTLAMALNTLVASPGFSRWGEGVPLDIQAMLFTPAGKPRHAIFSIAHLGDAERMFFVSLLLNQVLGWVRTQSGTSSLRALVYMDEIAGYMPPTANPPSKQPMLTLMKQARAFGVGVMLATQNPVDLDYKGLSNAGTWFIGRLQTERDKQRVLDGLEGAAAEGAGGFDRAACDALLSGLASRVFLMNNVHDRGPVVFETRWTMSYLRGPITRAELRRLAEGARVAAPAPAAATASTEAPAHAALAAAVAPSTPARPTRAPAQGSSSRPLLPPEIPQYFLPARTGAVHEYTPMLLGVARVYYSDARAGVEAEVGTAHLCPFGDGPVVVDFDHMEQSDVGEKDVEREPGQAAVSATYAALPSAAAKPRSFEDWRKGYADALFRTHKLEVFRCPSLKLTSKADETEGAFKARLGQVVREQRDREVDRLRAKYAPKVQALEERLRRAEQTAQVQREQARDSKVSSALSFGSALLGAFMGRKVVSATNVSKAATAMKSVGRAGKEASDVGRAEENIAAVREQIAELERRLKDETDALGAELEATAADVEQVALKPKRTNITVKAMMLVWCPRSADGAAAW
ncbi:MAG: ATP-binding protein [Phycisphaerales bacterium]